MKPHWKSGLEAPILVLGIVLVILVSAPARSPGSRRLRSTSGGPPCPAR